MDDELKEVLNEVISNTNDKGLKDKLNEIVKEIKTNPKIKIVYHIGKTAGINYASKQLKLKK